jgi:hypothetical protein
MTWFRNAEPACWHRLGSGSHPRQSCIDLPHEVIFGHRVAGCAPQAARIAKPDGPLVFTKCDIADQARLMSENLNSAAKSDVAGCPSSEIPTAHVVRITCLLTFGSGFSSATSPRASARIAPRCRLRPPLRGKALSEPCTQKPSVGSCIVAITMRQTARARSNDKVTMRVQVRVRRAVSCRVFHRADGQPANPSLSTEPISPP